jgi:hypothetical protein
MTNTVWNSGDSTAHIALSDTDHTATSGSGSGNEGIRGNVSRGTSGKWYIEFTGIVTPYGGEIGFAAASDTLGGNGQFGINTSGYIFSGGTDYGPLTAISGHVLDFAVDFDNNELWVREDGGNWNGSGTADPATNTGGISIAGYTGPVFPYAWLQFNPCSVTVDGGDYPSPTFLYPAPAGFSAWNGSSYPTGTWASTDVPDSFSAVGYSGAPGVVVNLQATEATDTFAATVLLSNLMTMAVFESADVFSAYAFQELSGVWTPTEAKDAFAAAGLGWGTNGIWASTEATDIMVASAAVPVTGTWASTEPTDRCSIFGEGVSQVRRRRPIIIT